MDKDTEQTEFFDWVTARYGQEVYDLVKAQLQSGAGGRPQAVLDQVLREKYGTTNTKGVSRLRFNSD